VPPKQGLPHFRKIYLSNIQAKNTDTFIHCVGAEQSPVQEVEMRDCDIEAAQYGTIQFTEDFQMINNTVAIKTK
jgi:hypothetical protein